MVMFYIKRNRNMNIVKTHVFPKLDEGSNGDVLHKALDGVQSRAEICPCFSSTGLKPE